nr:hypothetical protein [Marinicella sp. W31]MDC2880247.1 hypothetical protein [Marinicella sp. W31]
MSQQHEPFVRLIGVGKSFGAVQVLKDIDFDVRPGEVHALWGKTALANPP